MLRHGWIKGQNHQPPQQSDSISFRSLIPAQTKNQAKQRNNISRCWVPNKENNSRTKKIEGASLVLKHINEGNAEEANHSLGRLIFEKEIKPNLEIIAAGVEKELITFVAEDIW